MALVAMAYALPVKHLVWSQGAAVAAMLLCLPWQRALSAELCPASDGRYQRAAGVLAAAAAAVLPAPLGTLALQLQQRLDGRAFYVVHSAALLASFALVLAVLLRLELSHRLVFARRRRLAAEAAALQRRRGWLGLSAATALWAALAWLACCGIVLLLP